MELKLGMFTGDCYEYVKNIQEESAQEKARLICRKAQNVYRYAEDITGVVTEIGKRNRFTEEDNFEIGSSLLIYLAGCFRYKNTRLFQLPLPIECDLSNLATQTYRDLYYHDRIELATIACSDVHYDYVCRIRHLWNDFVEAEADALFRDYSELVRWTVDAVTTPKGHLHINYCQQGIERILNEIFSDLVMRINDEEALVS